ncbi:Os12g0103951 [Oryza sativa Japonica Group]|uniref:Os12g0103951 protein n=1 Tax=Oryza sativa subsp. japonica TaxID=39947 RepID=A0A0P0Y5U8_ORYSJ|nr:Os12g0103951 [Oryza sativa Japonica Group]
MESPEGVDVTSAVSNEVDRDDKVMHVLPLATEWPCSAASMALLGGSFAAGVARASHFSGFVTAVAPEQATLPPPPSPSRLRVLRTSPRLRLRCTSSSTARPPVCTQKCSNVRRLGCHQCMSTTARWRRWSPVNAGPRQRGGADGVPRGGRRHVCGVR